MSKKEKQLAKLLSGRSDKGFTFAELATILKSHGYELDRVKGSHHSFVNQDGDIITLPKQRPQMKPIYAKKVRTAIQGQTP